MRVAIIVILLLLTACGTASRTTQVFTGTEGLNIRFLDNAPPEEVYEGRPFPVRFEISNRGAYFADYTTMYVTFSDDPLYIKGGITPYSPAIHNPYNDGLEGKSLTYPQG